MTGLSTHVLDAVTGALQQVWRCHCKTPPAPN